MSDSDLIYEPDRSSAQPDPDEVPIRDRRLFTQPYDLVVEALMDQIKGGTIFLRPSRLIESILLNVPIPPCYLSQDEEFELDVIDGQQPFSVPLPCIHPPPPDSFFPRLNHIAPQLDRISRAPSYLMGKESERSLIGGLDRPKPVILDHI